MGDVEECTLECLHGKCSLKSVADASQPLETCECLEGWGGRKCNMQYKVCSDGHMCYNGSECVAGSDGTMGCDCSTAFEYSAFAGHMCEHPATSYCEYGTSMSSKSFCANQGTCKDYVLPGEDGDVIHPGCFCPSGFEGDHCQYLKGDAPVDPPPRSSAGLSQPSSSTPNNPNNLQPGAIVVIVLVSFAVVLGLTCLVRRGLKQQPKPISFAGNLDPDGHSLQHAHHTLTSEQQFEATAQFQQTMHKKQKSLPPPLIGTLQLDDVDGDTMKDAEAQFPMQQHKQSKSLTSITADIKDAMAASVKSLSSPKTNRTKHKQIKHHNQQELTLDPDGDSLKQAMEDANSSVGSLDTPTSRRSHSSITDDFNAAEGEGEGEGEEGHFLHHNTTTDSIHAFHEPNKEEDTFEMLEKQSDSGDKQSEKDGGVNEII